MEHAKRLRPSCRIGRQSALTQINARQLPSWQGVTQSSDDYMALAQFEL
jgi:hypothetical protein